MKKGILMVLISTMVFFAKTPEKTVEKYLNGIKIGPAVEYKNLKIYPLEITVPLVSRDFTTLDQAMDKGWLKIREVGSGEVNKVEIKNNGNEPVFVLTGEMITGAKQDRMIKADVLLPPNSGWVKVEVFCVEHGRWVSVSEEFKSGGLVVPNTVRQSAKVNESQAEVWAEVARTQDKLGIASGTGTVRANYEDKEVQRSIEEYAAGFGKIPKLSKSTIGVVVTTRDRIICLDMFANNSLLSKLWKKLIKSYAMDAIQGEKSTISRQDIENFIQSFEDAKHVSTGTPGLGTMLSIQSDIGKGSALVYDNTVIHMDFFPSEQVIDDSGLRLDFRRDQRMGE
ncbi:MAG: ARPP-1 family domain-containing protein [bacterium]